MKIKCCNVLGVLFLITILHPKEVLSLPFRQGERIIYELRISGVPIGTMETRFDGQDTYMGKPTYKWYARSEYKNTIDEEFFHSTTDRFLPLLVKRQIKRGAKQVRNVTEVYDQKSKILQIVDNDKRELFTYSSEIYNIVLLPYYLRTLHIKKGDEFFITIPKVSFTLSAIKEEIIETPIGSFETLLLRSHPSYTSIWLKVDNPVIPIRIDVKYVFFRMTMILKGIENDGDR